MNDIKGNLDISKFRKTERQLGEMGRLPLSAYRDDLSEWEVLPKQLKEGDPVLIESYGATGVLLENPIREKESTGGFRQY